MQGLAAYAIVNAAPFGVIPDHVNALQIKGTFRSKPPPIVIDKQKVKNALIDAAIIAGFAALTSFAIYALVITANNNSNRKIAKNSILDSDVPHFVVPRQADNSSTFTLFANSVGVS